MFLRKSHGSRLNVFAPINDLSLLSRSEAEDKSLVPGQKNDVEIAGGQMLGDEYSDHVVKVRPVPMWQEMTHELPFCLESQRYHSQRKVGRFCLGNSVFAGK